MLFNKFKIRDVEISNTTMWVGRFKIMMNSLINLKSSRKEHKVLKHLCFFCVLFCPAFTAYTQPYRARRNTPTWSAAGCTTCYIPTNVCTTRTHSHTHTHFPPEPQGKQIEQEIESVQAAAPTPPPALSASSPPPSYPLSDLHLFFLYILFKLE